MKKRSYFLSEDEKNIILSNQEKSIAEISRMINRTEMTVSRYAKKNGLRLRDGRKKYTCNKPYAFDNWSASMSYFLGFIYADGNVSKNKLTVSVSRKDVDILEKIKLFLGSDQAIWSYNSYGYPQSVIRINNARMASSLKNLGVIPRKSLTLKWPNDIPSEFINHFVRGYFDGDGSVTIRNDTGNVAIVIIGTVDFLSGIQDEFSKIYGKRIGSLSGHNNTKISRLYYHGNRSAIRFLDWIYGNSTEKNRLNRKYEIYREVQSFKHS